MDTGGLLGPNYSYADELATPTELGIKRDGSFNGIMRAVGGVSYYVDSIGFGETTSMSKLMGMPDQTPLGIQYFIKTGMTCSNGADLYEYVSTVPSGLQGRVGEEVERTLGVHMRGMGPGILEDALGALNPLPMLKSAMGSGYPKCKKVTMPVGDMRGRISGYNNNQWIKEPVRTVNGRPAQTRWVFDRYISQEEYDAEIKNRTVQAGALPDTEGFVGNSGTPLVAGLIFATLFLGVLALKA